MLCATCHSDSPADSAECRACGRDLPVDAKARAAADAKRKAAEIAELKAKIAAKKAAEDQAAAEAAALAMSEAELEDLRKQAAEAGVA